MKKWLSIFLVLSLALSLLAACGQNTEKKDETEASTQQQTQPVETESSTQPQESLEQGISFNDDAITLVTPGETMSVYNGTVPVAEVSFTTDNPYVATIEKNTLVITAAGIARVEMGWQNACTHNLYNAAGYLASPFQIFP